MTTLCELFAKYGSDKHCDLGHQYGPVYERLLAPVQETATSILELGVYQGASLRAWRDFFVNSQVFGFDECHEIFEERIRCFRGRQDRIEDLAYLLEKSGLMFDLIVDDCSHVPRHQIGSLCVLHRFLKTGGIYVVEDVRNEQVWQAFREFFPEAELIDTRPTSKLENDLLVIVRNQAEDRCLP